MMQKRVTLPCESNKRETVQGVTGSMPRDHSLQGSGQICSTGAWDQTGTCCIQGKYCNLCVFSLAPGLTDETACFLCRQPGRSWCDPQSPKSRCIKVSHSTLKWKNVSEFLCHVGRSWTSKDPSNTSALEIMSLNVSGPHTAVLILVS